MGNYIDCQLVVDGTKESIKKFKKLTIKKGTESSESSYQVCFSKLMPGITGVMKREHFNRLQLGDETRCSALILEDFVNDFDFRFDRSNTFYDWFGSARYTNWAVWVDQENWSHLHVTKTSLAVKFTVLENPPIILIIAASKLFPDLNFKMTFFDVFNDYEAGQIEITNSIINGVNIEYNLINN